LVAAIEVMPAGQHRTRLKRLVRDTSTRLGDLGVTQGGIHRVVRDVEAALRSLEGLWGTRDIDVVDAVKAARAVDEARKARKAGKGSGFAPRVLAAPTLWLAGLLLAVGLTVSACSFTPAPPPRLTREVRHTTLDGETWLVVLWPHDISSRTLQLRVIGGAPATLAPLPAPRP